MTGGYTVAAMQRMVEAIDDVRRSDDDVTAEVGRLRHAVQEFIARVPAA